MPVTSPLSVVAIQKSNRASRTFSWHVYEHLTTDCQREEMKFHFRQNSFPPLTYALTSSINSSDYLIISGLLIHLLNQPLSTEINCLKLEKNIIYFV